MLDEVQLKAGFYTQKGCSPLTYLMASPLMRINEKKDSFRDYQLVKEVSRVLGLMRRAESVP